MDGVADYTFVSSLGELGHGRLYLARTPQRLGLDTPLVGVKVFEQATDEDTLRRATRELRAFAAVRSPHLVTLHDAGRDGSWFYYAMEHCSGGSLAAPNRPLGRSEQLAAVSVAARGAHALHEAGMVHRGIHPGTILVTDDGARLGDLGLADVLEPTTSVTGLGPAEAVEFIDPAVLSGATASPASDIWSLGATLHKVLTGVGLYGELPTHDPLLAVRRVLTQSPRLSDELDAPEADLIRRCVLPDPEDRPRTALAFAEELERLAGG